MTHARQPQLDVDLAASEKRFDDALHELVHNNSFMETKCYPVIYTQVRDDTSLEINQLPLTAPGPTTHQLKSWAISI